MKARSIPSLLALALVPAAAHAYPIFYKCDASGRADDVLDSKDIRAKVLAMPLPTQADVDAKIAKICEDNAECFSILKQAFLLTQDTASAANELYEREVREIEAKLKKIGDEIRVDSEVPEIAKNLLFMTDSVNECRQSQLRRSYADYVFQGHDESDTSTGFDLFIQHGVDNEYNFVSGLDVVVKDKENGGYKRVDQKTDYDHVATIIEDAVAAGVDPYMGLAVAYMEAGHAEPFMIDPMPAMAAMGCLSEKIAKVDDSNAAAYQTAETNLRKSGQPFLYNWGTFYKFTPKVSTNGAATKFYEKLRSAKSIVADGGGIIRDEPGYACVQNEGAFLTGADGAVLESFGKDSAPFAKSKACCMKIPYVTKRIFSIMANTEMGNHLKSGSSDPAKVIQGFNGMGVIGLSEKSGVGAFRFGMRMRDAPQYGAQAMDFILNSFMSNPMIRHLVEEEEERYGTHPKSVICTGKGAGTYAVDSNKYLDMQKGMKRLATVIDRPWSDLSGLERSMVKHEIDFVLDFAGKDHPKLSAAQNARFQAQIDIVKAKYGPMKAKEDAAVSASNDATFRAYEYAIDHGGKRNKALDEAAESAKNVALAATRAAVAAAGTLYPYYQKEIYPLRDTLYKTSTRSWERFSDSEIAEIHGKIMRAQPQGD